MIWIFEGDVALRVPNLISLSRCIGLDCRANLRVPHFVEKPQSALMSSRILVQSSKYSSTWYSSTRLGNVVVAMATICWSYVLVLLLTLAALIAPSQPLFQPPAGEVSSPVVFAFARFHECADQWLIGRGCFCETLIMICDSSGYELRSTRTQMDRVLKMNINLFDCSRTSSNLHERAGNRI